MYSESLDLIKQRDNKRYVFEKSKGNIFCKLYCQLRIIDQREIKFAKSEFFSNKTVENKNSPRTL